MQKHKKEIDETSFFVFLPTPYFWLRWLEEINVTPFNLSVDYFKGVPSV